MIFFTQKRPVRIWGGYRFLSREKSSRSVNLAIHLHPVPRSRISGAMLLLPYMPSWRGQWQLYCFCLTCVHSVLTLTLADKNDICQQTASLAVSSLYAELVIAFVIFCDNEQLCGDAISDMSLYL